MIITAKASTIRSAAKRAGELKNLTIRSGRSAERAEHSYVDADSCSVRIAADGGSTQEYLECLSYRYGFNVRV